MILNLPTWLPTENMSSSLAWYAVEGIARFIARTVVLLQRLAGHQNMMGPPFKLKDPPVTWPEPDEQIQLRFTSRRGYPYQVTIQAWHNMLMRGKNKPECIRIYQSPFTLVRIVVLDEDGKPRFKHPLWLLVVGPRRFALSLEHIFQAYSQRSDLEHFFRFGKQKLLMADEQTPDLEREERW